MRGCRGENDKCKLRLDDRDIGSYYCSSRLAGHTRTPALNPTPE
jgi:hypothetical protein